MLGPYAVGDETAIEAALAANFSGSSFWTAHVSNKQVWFVEITAAA